MFAEHLHIPPWQVGDLSVDEFEQAIDVFDRRIKESEQK